jgi:hypothetical protein
LDLDGLDAFKRQKNSAEAITLSHNTFASNCVPESLNVAVSAFCDEHRRSP